MTKMGDFSLSLDFFSLFSLLSLSPRARFRTATVKSHATRSLTHSFANEHYYCTSMYLRFASSIAPFTMLIARTRSWRSTLNEIRPTS